MTMSFNDGFNDRFGALANSLKRVLGKPNPQTEDVQDMKTTLASYVENTVKRFSSRDGQVWSSEAVSKVVDTISKPLGVALAEIESKGMHTDTAAAKDVIDTIINQHVTLERLKQRAAEVENLIKNNMESLTNNYGRANLVPEARNWMLSRSLLRTMRLKDEINDIKGHIDNLKKQTPFKKTYQPTTN